jgi:predicted RNA binding protein YcfA (HicA-like mRNA interferase family)
MSKVPSLSYTEVIRALQRDSWVVVRQKESHIRFQKHLAAEVLKVTVPAHRPIKRSTQSHILKQARLSVD